MAFRRLACVLSALFIVSAAAFGQLPGIGGGEEPDQTAPDHLANPQATMATFLVAMGDEKISRALETLDLSGLGVTRGQEGEQLAFRLLEVMNKTELIDVRAITDATGGAPYTWHDFGATGSIVIAKQPDGAWRFTSATVASINDIWQSTKDLDTIAGLSEIDLFLTDKPTWLKHKFPAGWPEREVFGASLWQIVSGLILIAVAFLAGVVIRLITRWLVRSSFKVNEEIASKKKIGSLGRGISLVANVALIGIGLPFLDLPPFLLTPILFALKIANAVGWLWVFNIVWDVFVAVVASRAGEKAKSAKKVIVPIASKFGRFFIFIGVVVFFVSQLGYNVGALMAGLGIGGLVFALAAKDSVENLFGSITILMEMPFGVGDWVKIGDIDGNVESINLRSTRIRTFQDSLITLPNSRMITSHVENFGMRRRRRIKTTLGLAYDTPPEKIAEFCERVRQMLLDDERIWNDKRYVYFNNFGDSTLDVMLYCFIIAETWQLELEYRDEILREVLVIAKETGVEFAFPTRRIVFASGSDDASKLPVQ